MTQNTISPESPRITLLREELKNGHSQALEAFWPRLVGLHESEETSTDADKVIVAMAELLRTPDAAP